MLPFILQSHRINTEGLRQSAEGLTGMVSTAPREESGEKSKESSIQGADENIKEGIAQHYTLPCIMLANVFLDPNLPVAS